MNDSTSGLAVRRPEHTGEQRCWPCTVVNLVVLAGAVLALVFRVGPLAGALVGAAGAVIIWFRGYLVPGTPRFAPPLVAAVPGGEALFHEGDATGGDAGGRPEAGDGLGSISGDDDGEAVLEALLESGAVEADGDAISLATDVNAALAEEIDTLASLPTPALADEVTATLPDRSARAEYDEDLDREWIALDDGEHALEETWLRRPVAVADVAAVRALAEYVPDEHRRLAAAAPLRTFLETCPDCGTALQPGSTVPCCGGYNGQTDVPEETLACPECDARIVTLG